MKGHLLEKEESVENLHTAIGTYEGHPTLLAILKQSACQLSRQPLLSRKGGLQKPANISFSTSRYHQCSGGSKFGGERRDHLTGKRTCGHCGKYTSASYHKRNPLANGEWPKPSICTKCAKDKTSSEGSSDSERRYRKKRQRRRRHSLLSMPSRYSLSSWASESDDGDNTRVRTIITSAPSGVISHRNSRRRSSTRGVRVIEYSEGSEEFIPWRSRPRSRSLRRYVETVFAIGLFKDGKPTLTAIDEAPHVGTQRLDPMVTVNIFKKPKGRFALMLIFIISKIGGRHSSIAKSDTVLSLVADCLVRTIVAWEAILVFDFHGHVGGLMDIAMVRIAI